MRHKDFGRVDRFLLDNLRGWPVREGLHADEGSETCNRGDTDAEQLGAFHVPTGPFNPDDAIRP